ncbi:hypothetical protein M3J09_013430 [Ascochyta lentis]
MQTQSRTRTRMFVDRHGQCFGWLVCMRRPQILFSRLVQNNLTTLNLSFVPIVIEQRVSISVLFLFLPPSILVYFTRNLASVLYIFAELSHVLNIITVYYCSGRIVKICCLCTAH